MRPRHGEKPYEVLVEEAFDGPVLRLSQRLRILEEANTRRIRRGDALDLIAAKQRELEAKHAVCKPSRLRKLALHVAAFVGGYAVLAAAWCVVMR